MPVIRYWFGEHLFSAKRLRELADELDAIPVGAVLNVFDGDCFIETDEPEA